MLKFSNQTYQRNRILFSIDRLELNRGELVILLGANGTGKSTWLQSLVHPEKNNNDFLIDEKKASEINRLEMAKTVAFIDNHFSGLDNLTVQEYISLGRFPYTGISGRLHSADEEIVSKVSNHLNIGHLLSKPTSSLSDGERQKCGIAKALVQETPLILLDEPSSFLDYPSKQELFQLLTQITASEQKLIIVSTHDIDLGLEFGTKWCIINRNNQFIALHEKPTKSQLLEISFG